MGDTRGIADLGDRELRAVGIGEQSEDVVCSADTKDIQCIPTLPGIISKNGSKRSLSNQRSEINKVLHDSTDN